MAAASASSSNNDRARTVPMSAEKQGRDQAANLPLVSHVAATTSAANEAQAKIEIEARKATEAVDQARRKLEADEVAAQHVAATVLPLDATDAQIDELALATLRATKRVELSKRSLAATEEAARPIVEQAAEIARAAAWREAIEDQAEIVDRFRSEYPEVVNKLWRLFVEAHAFEMTAQKLLKDRVEGEEPYVSAFRFTGPYPPIAICIQAIGIGGEVIWQGDQNSDVDSQQF